MEVKLVAAELALSHAICRRAQDATRAAVGSSSPRPFRTGLVVRRLFFVGSEGNTWASV